MSGIIKPELLAPAGDRERLEAAVDFGADAVYLGSDCFGMRTAAASFGGEELKFACDYAHSKGVKVYLTCNTLARNDEILKSFEMCLIIVVIIDVFPAPGDPIIFIRQTFLFKSSSFISSEQSSFHSII